MTQLILMILLPLILPSATPAGGPPYSASPKESTMFLEASETTAKSTIPPIDRAAPQKFETAAFGLG